MSKFFAPLKVFVLGQVLMLLLFLLVFPVIGTPAGAIAANEHVSTFWGLSWAATAIKLIIVVVVELGTLYVAARAFLSERN